LVTPKEQGALDVHFCPLDNCEQVMINYLLNASEIKCAFYDLNLENLINVLKEKKAEVLVFEDNFDNYGLSVTSKGLMHNKFCVLDGRAVITGSMNPTFNGAYKNNNNLVYIESKTFAKNYLNEFKEIKDKKQRGSVKKILFNSYEVENCFCPEDNCQKEVLKELSDAKKSIYFMTFSFTDKDISNLLIKKDKDLVVEGLMESKRINQKYNVFKLLNSSKMKLYLDKNPYTMHHKVFIIDKKTVILGSYNPTASANTKNDENILIVHNENFAREFLKEFNLETQT